ncbi:DEAD/DEAH box helicase [Pararoseomonas indoligenes]|uniref:DEAD/DEAH box helicase n=1 Tax=Roseomonas indoligenes TaxID=2820811 RepID=UPI001FD7A241|nr:DEAD/DEAH box helicase [Pararoseomonas indoligenes]
MSEHDQPRPADTSASEERLGDRPEEHREAAREGLPQGGITPGAAGSIQGAADGDPVGEGSSPDFAERPAAFESAEPVAALASDAPDAGGTGADRDEDPGETGADYSDPDDESEDEDVSGSDPVADESSSEDDEDEDEDDEEEAAAAPRATFADLGLSEPILQAVAETGYVHPTPIQEAAIPVVLMGRDVLGCAQTGTGKTAGFTLPMLDILAGSRAKARMPRSLILEPTRELALQVAENFVKYGKYLNLTHALLIGGESMDEQKAVLEKGVDVLIATPGRLLDLFDRGRILLADCKVLVIDEADRMLDMGFIPDVERIVSMLPKMRQTLFFSATMAPEIKRLADAFLQNPREISVSAPASVATTITAGLFWVGERDKREALRRLIKREAVQNALIFCNRKVDVDILYKSLKKHGFSVGALHGDLAQSVRFATLEKFKNNELQLLVCSDVAARGIDIGGLSHVFNFDVPYHAEDYVHRIGRTGRAGREGHAYTLATADEAKAVAAVETLTGRPIPPMAIEGLDPVNPEDIQAALKATGRGRGRGRGGESRGGREAGRGERGRGEARRDRGGEAREGARREGSGRRDEPRREEKRKDEPRREEREARPGRENRGAERVLDEVNRDAAREWKGEDRPRGDDRARREERFREDRPREERGRRDDRRYRQDDLGPSVVGFGDAVPAFMLIPLPRPRRVRDDEAEAA